MKHTIKDLNDAMDQAFKRCYDVPYDLPNREDEIRSRYVNYVARLESLLVRTIHSEDLELAVERLRAAG